MRRFRFSLEPVLKLARRNDRTERVRLARAQSELAQLRARADLLAAARVQAEKEALRPSPTVGLATAYQAVIATRQQAISLEISAASARATDARARWIQAYKRRESLQRLRDLRERNYLREVTRLEQLELEQLCALRTERRAER